MLYIFTCLVLFHRLLNKQFITQPCAYMIEIKQFNYLILAIQQCMKYSMASLFLSKIHRLNHNPECNRVGNGNFGVPFRWLGTKMLNRPLQCRSALTPSAMW